MEVSSTFLPRFNEYRGKTRIIIKQINKATGSPSSKYEHRRTSALLRNIRNIRICMRKKPIVSETYENERQLTLLKMCTGRFMVLCLSRFTERKPLETKSRITTEVQFFLQ